MKKILTVKGAVQGVGYRPFVATLATEYALQGYIKNHGSSVEILISGDDPKVSAFLDDLNTNAPEGALILEINETPLTEEADIFLDKNSEFQIIESSDSDFSKEIPIFLPDIGVCDSCLAEMLDKKNRRYRYPLISCASCGPRMSIINTLPYDRNTTTMDSFSMCKECQKEYSSGHRKYAQTISCHSCGPQMIFESKGKKSKKDQAVNDAVQFLKNNMIIGLKGISGYQLICLPTAENAIRLREIKRRENKPFAIMFSTIEEISAVAHVSPLERELLTSSARPIVLLKKKKEFPEDVTRKSRYIGAFLPSAGIHRLLCDELGPLIVTSANLSDEPMIINDEEFKLKFFNAFIGENSRIDGILYHKRKINLPQDDSVMFVIGGKYGESGQFIRRARGFVPLPVIIPQRQNSPFETSVFAFGGDLKNTFCFALGDKALMSGHVGDISDYDTYENYLRQIDEYKTLFGQKPQTYICDLHPGYQSFQTARKLISSGQEELLKLQHHFAHIYSVMAENGLERTIGVALDGTGYGLDGKIWGGELVFCNFSEAKRLGHLSYVKLAGGTEAPKNARSIQHCYEHELLRKGVITYRDLSHCENESLLDAALDNNINTFETSSTGRLFDAVSSLLGIKSYNSYEGECATFLEAAAWEYFDKERERSTYPQFHFNITEKDGEIIADQLTMYADILKYYKNNKTQIYAISFGFHMALANLIKDMCAIVRKNTGEKNVCLSGGVFNNRLVLTKATEFLIDKGFSVYWNQKTPLGDGGLSLGQAYYGLLYKNRSK